MAQKIQIRRDTTSNWSSSNPVLSQGEFGLDTTIGAYKVGNGSTAWNSLPYYINTQPLNLSEGSIINGVITPNITSSNLTLSIKTLAGTNPSATDPVFIVIGGVVRTITSALSVTYSAGFNFFNAGSRELATKEINYFIYIYYSTTLNSIKIGFSRIPFGLKVNNFSGTTTNEKFMEAAYTGNSNPSDSVVNIGRFSTILSAGPGFTWSTPAGGFNVINRPIYETDWLDWSPVYTGFSLSPTSTGTRYKISMNKLYYYKDMSGSAGTSNATTKTISLPFASAATASGSAHLCNILLQDNGSFQASAGYGEIYGSSIKCFKTFYQGAFTNTGNCNIYLPEQFYQI